MLSSIVVGGLSGLFGSYGILTLVKAYRAGNLADWGKLAIIGGLNVLLSAVLAYIAVTLLMPAASGRDTKPSSYIPPAAPTCAAACRARSAPRRG
jgi:hypothetical protein